MDFFIGYLFQCSLQTERIRKLRRFLKKMNTPAGPDSRTVQIVRPDYRTGVMNSERMDGSDNSAICWLRMYRVTKLIACVMAAYLAITLWARGLTTQSSGVGFDET